MPLFNYECGSCKFAREFLLDEPKEWIGCGRCRGIMKRAPKPPTVQVKEVLDSGAMTRRLERFSNAEEMFRGRDKNRQD